MYGADSEDGLNSVEDAVCEIRSKIAKVSEDTEADWKYKSNVRASICWGVILVLVTNYFWSWIPFPSISTLVSSSPAAAAAAELTKAPE